MATSELTAGMKTSSRRRAKSVPSVWAPPSATSNPVAFSRKPPPRRAAAIPSFTTHQKMEPNIPSLRAWEVSSSTSTTSAIMAGTRVKRPPSPKAMRGAGTMTSQG